jgi:hypothetical protein
MWGLQITLEVTPGLKDWNFGCLYLQATADGLLISIIRAQKTKGMSHVLDCGPHGIESMLLFL